MYKLQANPTGTRNIVVTESHMETIERYSLLENLVESNGIIDEGTLEKLRSNIRSFIFANEDCKDLIDLCYNVIYHNDMKAFGLRQLMMLFIDWRNRNTDQEN